MTDVRISPVPTDEETAAIVAALHASTPGAATQTATPARRGNWRFSGRWWSTPLAVRRARPWR